MSILNIVRDIPKDINRLRSISTILVKHGFGHIIERLNINDSSIIGLLKQADQTEAKKPPQAARLRRTLIDLGPTFIKLGQTMSTRSDLPFPQDVIDELQNLQDRVPPFKFEEVSEVIKSEFGQRPEDIFESFEKQPLASASIGQVHLAKLKNGDEVVVKVQRPGIKQIILADLDILYYLAWLIEKSIPESRVFQPLEVVKEFDRVIRREIDFTIEANNALRAFNNFQLNDDVVIAEVYPRFSGKRVMTMEYVQGTKITNYHQIGADPEKIARIILQAIFKQIFEDGFFHSDPHPGNLSITRDHRLIFYDFGQMGKINDALRDQILLLLLSIAREDREGVTTAFYDIGIKTVPVDYNEFRLDVDDVLDGILGKPLEDLNFGPLFKNLIVKAQKHQMRVPPNFTLVAKTCITLETVVRELSPQLKIFEEIKPFILRLLVKRFSFDRFSQDAFKLFYQINSTSQKVPHLIQDISDKLGKGNFSIKVENTETAKITSLLHHTGTRLSLSLISGSLFLGSSLLIGNGVEAGWYGFIAAGILALHPLVTSLVRKGE